MPNQSPHEAALQARRPGDMGIDRFDQTPGTAAYKNTFINQCAVLISKSKQVQCVTAYVKGKFDLDKVATDTMALSHVRIFYLGK